MICDTDDTCREKLHYLIQDDHTVSYIPEDSLYDERPLYASPINTFARGSSRVLLMSFDTWYQLIDVLEERAMGHNLLVMTDLDTQEKLAVMRWVEDAESRGFIRDRIHYHIFIEDHPSFSVHQE